MFLCLYSPLNNRKFDRIEQSLYIYIYIMTNTFCFFFLFLQSYDSLRHISKLAKLDVPKNIVATIESMKENDEAIRNFGISQAVEMCRELLDSGDAPGLHFYTLNRDYATNCILKQLGLRTVDIQRSLPWKPSANYVRIDEEVRPIFWNMRPQSYICRTSDWDKFPNGRWGNSSLASFGKLTDYYMFHFNQYPKAELLKMWGTHLEKEEDVWNVFKLYITGETNESGIKVRIMKTLFRYLFYFTLE